MIVASGILTLILCILIGIGVAVLYINIAYCCDLNTEYDLETEISLAELPEDYWMIIPARKILKN